VLRVAIPTLLLYTRVLTDTASPVNSAKDPVASVAPIPVVVNPPTDVAEASLTVLAAPT
jgi:hypothetical protein